MAKIDEIIQQMPLITQRAKMNGHSDPSMALMMQNMLLLIQDLLKRKDDSAIAPDITIHADIKEVLLDLRNLIEKNDKPFFITEVKHIIQQISDKIDNPIVNVEGNKAELEAVKRSIDALKFPDNKAVTVNNLNVLEAGLRKLESRLDSLNNSVSELEFIAPDTVSIKNLKDLEVNFPREAIELLKLLENLKTSAKNPLAVRLSDGTNYYKAVAKAVREGVQAVAMNSGNEAPAKQITSGVKSLAGSTVQLTATSVKVRWVDVVAIKTPASIGDSSTNYDVTTPANHVGLYLTPGNVHKMRVEDPSLLYVDGPSGGGVGYNYYV